MSLEATIISALESAHTQEGPWLDPGNKGYAQGIQRALGARLDDKTDYARGRAYCFECPSFTPGDERWRTVLRVRISGVGPFATQTFVQESNEGHWWSGPIRSSRVGTQPEHVERLAKLRAWYQEVGVTEVDQATQAQLLPEHIPFPRRRDHIVTLFQALFLR
jgi:hypothetical protein